MAWQLGHRLQLSREILPGSCCHSLPWGVRSGPGQLPSPLKSQCLPLCKACPLSSRKPLLSQASHHGSSSWACFYNNSQERSLPRAIACLLALVIKSLPANAGGLRDTGSILGSGRSPGEGNGKLPQHSCLENPMDRGTWGATVHGVAKSQTRLKQLSTAHSTSQRCPRCPVLMQRWACSVGSGPQTPSSPLSLSSKT